jgi:hypothetical protein
VQQCEGKNHNTEGEGKENIAKIEQKMWGVSQVVEWLMGAEGGRKGVREDNGVGGCWG